MLFVIIRVSIKIWGKGNIDHPLKRRQVDFKPEKNRENLFKIRRTGRRVKMICFIVKSTGY